MDRKTYDRLYQESLANPDAFWSEQAKRIAWSQPPSKVSDWSFDGESARVGWFLGGKLNASVNCLDRHAALTPNKPALIFEPDSPTDPVRTLTYRELLELVCRASHALQSLGVTRGDRVTIYMPMIPEAVAAMLACARIGAIHSVVFGGFSPESLAGRIEDCKSAFIVTADEGRRGTKRIPLKANVDASIARLKDPSQIRSVIVVRATGAEVPWVAGRDHSWTELVTRAPTTFAPAEMDALDPLFILYTSGSTGKPKGVLHTTGGYLVYASLTHDVIFDHRPTDVYWCTADVGWITGHSYVVYGPLSNGSTVLIYEGIPTYPTPSRFWETVDKHRVTTFYTSPTALRSLLRDGDAPVKKTSRASLRILGSVGEPINAEAWHWYRDVVGDGRCPIVDTWWQTETGGIMISPIPGINGTDKPGAASLPFFGVEPALLDSKNQEVSGEAAGTLVMKRSWPGQAHTVYGDHARFCKTYFSSPAGYFYTGDGCRRDTSGDYWIGGRVDDVIKVSGHRLGTAEIESAIDEHASVVESAVVGIPHEIKGECIYAFVTLRGDQSPDASIKREIIELVRKIIGPVASPETIQFAAGLPKTRSGKIMRRILRKIAAGQTQDLGDTSTLADPGVVDELILNREH